MFDDKQREMLAANLDRKHVKSRNQAGRGVSYIEGWHAIAEANRIFGFDGWSRETVYCREVSRVEREIGDRKTPGWKVGYEAMVRIRAGDQCREGTGHGSGIATDLFDAIESAAKEAETDAMKRALMTFGNPFGLALYDKKQEHVGTPEPEPPKKTSELLRDQLEGSIAIERAKKDTTPVDPHRPPYADELDRFRRGADELVNEAGFRQFKSDPYFVGIYKGLPAVGKTQASQILAATAKRLGLEQVA